MLLRAHQSGFLLILAFCSFERISSSPQRQITQNAAVGSASPNQSGPETKQVSRLTDSFLPPVMQALAHYIELLQYEPLYSTTVEPPFTVSTTPLTVPSIPSSSTIRPPFQQPVTWWSPPSTTTTQKPWWSQTTTTTRQPITWWSPPSTTTTTRKPWWSQSTTAAMDAPEESTTTTTTTTTPPSTTRRPSVSTSTPNWWQQETTPYHKPGNFAPDRPISSSTSFAANTQIASKPSKPQVGDLSYLSVASFPHFEYFVKPKSFIKKPEYEYLHPYPAELLQEIEDEPTEYGPKNSEQEIVNEFRRVYDDFFTRVRVFAPVTGKKRVPPTRPYVLFLIFYDLCKREAKRLALQDFAGYSPSMLARLHETSTYSAEHQLYTLMYELLAQKSIVATDAIMRMNEIMTDLSDPTSVTAKSLHILPALKFEF